MKAKIQEDLKLAMRAQDKHRVTTLRGLISEIKRVEIDTRKELTQDDILNILQKEIKKRREAIEFAQKGDRQDLVDQNKDELEIIFSYVGKPLNDDELRSIIADIVKNGASALGQIMGELNKNHKGKFDGKLASSIAKELLQ